MNGGLVPLALLSATIGLMLAFVAARTAMTGGIAFAVAALVALAIPLELSPQVIFSGVWLSAIVAAILVYLPVARRTGVVLPLCLVAGFWLGACAALADDRFALLIGLLPLLIRLPSRWLAQRKFDIVIKVIASWMIAIASLSLFVSLISTPGYQPDHME